jgi:hypothetical protein
MENSASIPSIPISVLRKLIFSETRLKLPEAIRNRLQGTGKIIGCKKKIFVVHNFLNDDITLGDRVIVTTEKKKGVYLIRRSYQKHDPFLPNNGRSERIPFFPGSETLESEPASFLMGTVFSIEALRRTAGMKRSDPTKILFRLRDVRKVTPERAYEYYHLGSLVTEKVTLSFHGEIIETHRRTFHSATIPNTTVRKIPLPCGREAQLLQALQKRSGDAAPIPNDARQRILAMYV